MKREVIATINRCIYCGTLSGKLTDEHVVPYALGGTHILKQASCLECQKITSQIERSILRKTWLAPRAKLGLPTRRPQNRPTEIPLKVGLGGADIILNVPIIKRPTAIMFPLYEQPACLDRVEGVKGTRWRGVQLAIIGGVQAINAILEESGTKSVTFSQTFYSNDFAWLMAKIAYGFAVAAYGPRIIDTAYIREVILNRSDTVGYWVGCPKQSSPIKGKGHYQVGFVVSEEEIHAYIKLFPNPRIPEYLVIVGPNPSSGKH